MPTKSKTETLHELFEHELKDIYFAEQQLLRALEKMAKESSDEKVKESFEKHRQETQGHIERLKEIFEIMGKKPVGQKCDGILGLIEEKRAFEKEKPSKELLEFYNLGAATKVERYEISAYESLIDAARKHDMTEVIYLLEQNLKEEEKALSKVKSFIEEFDTSNIKSGMA